MLMSGFKISYKRVLVILGQIIGAIVGGLALYVVASYLIIFYITRIL